MDALEPRVLLADASSFPNSVVSFRGSAYFSADDGVHGVQIWKTNGSAESTSLVSLGLPAGFKPQRLIVEGDTLFIQPQNKPALWKTDGTAVGTKSILSLSTKEYRGIGLLKRVGNDLYLMADAGSYRDLWRVDLTTGASRRIDRGVYSITGALNGSILYTKFFTGGGLPHSELFVTGGALGDSVTQRQGLNSSSEISMTSIGNVAVVVTSRGFYRVTDLRGNWTLLEDSSSVQFVGALGSKLLYTRYTSSGKELWSRDVAGKTRTKLATLPDLFGRPVSSNGKLYLNVSINELWVTDGTPAGTHRVWQGDSDESAIQEMVSVGGKAFFLSEGSLWQSDATPDEAQKLSTPVDDLAIVPNLFTASGRVYLWGNDHVHGTELWAIDSEKSEIYSIQNINTQPIAPPAYSRFNADAHQLYTGSDWISYYSNVDLVVATGVDAQSVRLYVDGIQSNATGNNETLSLYNLSEGVHVITFASVAADGSVSAQSRRKLLTVNLHPSTINSKGISYGAGRVMQLVIRSSDPLTLQKSDFVLKNLGTGESLAVKLTEVEDGNPAIQTFQITRDGSSFIPNGQYELKLGFQDFRDTRGFRIRDDATLQFVHANIGQGAQSSPTLRSGVLVYNGTEYNDAMWITSASVSTYLFSVTFNGQTKTFDFRKITKVVLNGGNGNDVLSAVDLKGFGYSVQINGDAGDDRLTGSTYFNELFHGGDGNDWISAGGGPDTLYGDAGNDKLFGGTEVDWIDGGAGQDTLRGEGGTDRLIATIGLDDYSKNGGDVLTLSR